MNLFMNEAKTKFTHVYLSETQEKEKMMNFSGEKRNGGRARSLDPSSAVPPI
jgi:hypothetical protein